MGNSVLGWSVIGDYLNCQRYCYYRHVLKLLPRHPNVKAEKGTIFHEYLKHYYSGTLHTFSIDEAVSEAQQRGVIFENTDINHLHDTAKHYIDNFAGWKILEVEKELVIALGDVPYTMRLDLIVLDPHDQLIVIDHKTSDINTINRNVRSGALLGYWIGAQRSGYDVTRAMINQIVWAKRDDEGNVNYTHIPPQGLSKTQREIDTWLFQMERIVRDYLEKVKTVHEEKDVLNPLRFYKNLNQCYVYSLCRYHILCQHEVNPEGLELIYRIGE
jgi:hypothetical protein